MHAKLLVFHGGFVDFSDFGASTQHMFRFVPDHVVTALFPISGLKRYCCCFLRSCLVCWYVIIWSLNLGRLFNTLMQQLSEESLTKLLWTAEWRGAIPIQYYNQTSNRTTVYTIQWYCFRNSNSISLDRMNTVRSILQGAF